MKSVRVTVAVNDAGRAIGEEHINARYLNEDVENVRLLRRQGYTYRQISQAWLLATVSPKRRNPLSNQSTFKHCRCFSTHGYTDSPTFYREFYDP